MNPEGLNRDNKSDSQKSNEPDFELIFDDDEPSEKERAQEERAKKIKSDLEALEVTINESDFSKQDINANTAKDMTRDYLDTLSFAGEAKLEEIEKFIKTINNLPINLNTEAEELILPEDPEKNPQSDQEFQLAAGEVLSEEEIELAKTHEKYISKIINSGELPEDWENWTDENLNWAEDIIEALLLKGEFTPAQVDKFQKAIEAHRAEKKAGLKENAIDWTKPEDNPADLDISNATEKTEQTPEIKPLSFTERIKVASKKFANQAIDFVRKNLEGALNYQSPRQETSSVVVTEEKINRTELSPKTDGGIVDQSVVNERQGWKRNQEDAPRFGDKFYDKGRPSLKEASYLEEYLATTPIKVPEDWTVEDFDEAINALTIDLEREKQNPGPSGITNYRILFLENSIKEIKDYRYKLVENKKSSKAEKQPSVEKESVSAVIDKKTGRPIIEKNPEATDLDYIDSILETGDIPDGFANDWTPEQIQETLFDLTELEQKSLNDEKKQKRIEKLNRFLNEALVIKNNQNLKNLNPKESAKRKINEALSGEIEVEKERLNELYKEASEEDLQKTVKKRTEESFFEQNKNRYEGDKVTVMNREDFVSPQKIAEWQNKLKKEGSAWNDIIANAWRKAEGSALKYYESATKLNEEGKNSLKEFAKRLEAGRIALNQRLKSKGFNGEVSRDSYYQMIDDGFNPLAIIINKVPKKRFGFSYNDIKIEIPSENGGDVKILESKNDIEQFLGKMEFEFDGEQRKNIENELNKRANVAAKRWKERETQIKENALREAADLPQEPINEILPPKNQEQRDRIKSQIDSVEDFDSLYDLLRSEGVIVSTRGAKVNAENIIKGLDKARTALEKTESNKHAKTRFIENPHTTNQIPKVGGLREKVVELLKKEINKPKKKRKDNNLRTAA